MRILSTKQLAKRWNCHVTAVALWAKLGKIPSRVIGGNYVFSIHEITKAEAEGNIIKPRKKRKPVARIASTPEPVKIGFFQKVLNFFR